MLILALTINPHTIGSLIGRAGRYMDAAYHHHRKYGQPN